MSVDAINGAENYINEVSKKVQPVVPVVSSNIQITENSTNQDSINERKIKDAITGANNKLVQKRTRCEYSYNEDIKRVSIKVYDSETDEVLKEIPAEETLEMLEKIWELAGLLVDEKR